MPANEQVRQEPGVHSPHAHHQPHFEPSANPVLSQNGSDVHTKSSADMEKDAVMPVVHEHDDQPEAPPEYDIGEPVHAANPVFAKAGQFFHSRYYIILRDFALIGLLLGIWIPSVVRKQHRHKWVITTIISWFFISLILLHNSKYIPQRPFVRIISYVWGTFVERPFYRFPYYVRLAFGWACLAVLYLGTAFGNKATETSPYRPRGIALVGISLNYCALFAFSKNWRAVRASTTIVGLGLQMILGLLVYKTGAGYNLFGWISTALTDLLEQGQKGGATFFWSADMVSHSTSRLQLAAPLLV